MTPKGGGTSSGSPLLAGGYESPVVGEGGLVLLIDAIVNGVFAIIVFTAVMAVLLDVYGEVVFAAAVLLAIWLAAEVFGPTSLLALLLIMVAAGCRIVATMTAADLEGAMPRQLVMVLDELLTDREEQDGRDRR